MPQSRQTATYLAILTAWFYMVTNMHDLSFMVLQGEIGFIAGYNFVKSTYGRLWYGLSLVTSDGDMIPVKP